MYKVLGSDRLLPQRNSPRQTTITDQPNLFITGQKYTVAHQDATKLRLIRAHLRVRKTVKRVVASATNTTGVVHKHGYLTRADHTNIASTYQKK